MGGAEPTSQGARYVAPGRGGAWQGSITSATESFGILAPLPGGADMDGRRDALTEELMPRSRKLGCELRFGNECAQYQVKDWDPPRSGGGIDQTRQE